MNRDQAFGRLIAIATVLGDSVFDKGQIRISDKYLSRLQIKPADTITLIHRDLLEHAHKFDGYQIHLLDMFGEIMAGLDIGDFNNEPLDNSYLLDFYKKRGALYNVMGVEKAAEMWGLSPGTVKNYCADGTVEAIKIGKTWIIDKDHPNPKVD